MRLNRLISVHKYTNVFLSLLYFIPLSYKLHGPRPSNSVSYERTLSPSREEISKGIADIACHADEDGPFTAQVLDHDGGQEHGGQNDGSVDYTE